MEQIADPVDYALPAEFGIYTVTQVRRDLADALDAAGTQRGTVLAIAADRVEQVDGAALQLLVVLATELRRRGMRLHLVEPSPPLATAIRRLGAAGLLGLHPDTRTD
jgi:anti-anti-sigma regulatory factor